MKYILFLMINLFVIDISYSGDKIVEDSIARNIVANHISTPLENLYFIEKMIESKQADYLNNISSDDFIKSPDFNLLYKLIKTKKINSGSIVEKREKYFFIDEVDSNEILIVTFKRNSDGSWIPVEIQDSNESKPLLPDNHPLFSHSLSSTSDNFQFTEFSSYWEAQSGKKYKIIPTKYQDAIIEHVVFFGGGKADEQVFSIKIGFFLPKNSSKNGWLITDIKKESSKISYDVNKPRNYIPPFRLADMPKNVNDMEISYNPPPDHGMNIKIKNQKNIITKVACHDYEDKQYVRVIFYTNTDENISSSQSRASSGELVLNLQPAYDNIPYIVNNCPNSFIKIESNKISINDKMMPNLNNMEFGKSEKYQYVDFKY